MNKKCLECEYYYGEIDQCMYGEPDVPDDLVQLCKIEADIKEEK